MGKGYGPVNYAAPGYKAQPRYGYGAGEIEIDAELETGAAEIELQQETEFKGEVEVGRESEVTQELENNFESEMTKEAEIDGDFEQHGEIEVADREIELEGGFENRGEIEAVGELEANEGNANLGFGKFGGMGYDPAGQVEFASGKQAGSTFQMPQGAFGGFGQFGSISGLVQGGFNNSPINTSNPFNNGSNVAHYGGNYNGW